MTRFTHDATGIQTLEHYESNTKGKGHPEVLEACFLDDGATTLCVDADTVFVLGASNELYATAAHSLSQKLRLHNVTTKARSLAMSSYFAIRLVRTSQSLSATCPFSPKFN